MSEPIRVLVTGTGVRLRVHSCTVLEWVCLSKDQPIILVLLGTTPMMGVLHGAPWNPQTVPVLFWKMSLQQRRGCLQRPGCDCPCWEGLGRKDLLRANVKIDLIFYTEVLEHFILKYLKIEENFKETIKIPLCVCNSELIKIQISVFVFPPIKNPSTRFIKMFSIRIKTTEESKS